MASWRRNFATNCGNWRNGSSGTLCVARTIHVSFCVGRRIEWELDQCLGDYPENHDCFWPNTVPNPAEVASEKGLQLSLLRSFARPELIEPGSVAHWILTAWATNPRSPTLINIWPQLDFSSPHIPPVERDDTDGSTSLRTYIQNLYRDFETIAQPKLDQASVERLQHAHINLSATATMSSGLGSVYRPILARVTRSRFIIPAGPSFVVCSAHFST